MMKKELYSHALFHRVLPRRIFAERVGWALLCDDKIVECIGPRPHSYRGGHVKVPFRMIRGKE